MASGGSLTIFQLQSTIKGLSQTTSLSTALLPLLPSYPLLLHLLLQHHPCARWCLVKAFGPQHLRTAIMILMMHILPLEK
jgi:hypothetical protein